MLKSFRFSILYLPSVMTYLYIDSQVKKTFTYSMLLFVIVSHLIEASPLTDRSPTSEPELFVLLLQTNNFLLLLLHIKRSMLCPLL